MLPATLTYPQIAGVGSARTLCSSYVNGFLVGITDAGAGSCPGGAPLASVSYHPNGMVSQVGHGNGVTDTYTKDPNDMGRPYRISSSNALANWDSGSFEYDGAGNVKALRGMSEPVARPAATHQDYTYDAFANLTRITLNDTTYQDLPTSASTNRLTASGYDASGNMTAWGGYTYSYDPLNAMTVLTGGTLNKAYRYDAEGERISFREGASGPWTYSLRGLDGKVLREYSFNGSTWSWSKDVVYRNGMVLAAIDGTGTRNFTLDHLGSPRLITDASRTVLEYHAYWGYGAEIDTACGVERMKFTGHERDNQCTAGMLDYMHARYYNPTIGRFLAVDQGNGKPEAPGSWNRYGYARGNPILRFDPDGLADRLTVFVAFTPGEFVDPQTGFANYSVTQLRYELSKANQTNLFSEINVIAAREMMEPTVAGIRTSLAAPGDFTFFLGHLGELGLGPFVGQGGQAEFTTLKGFTNRNQLVVLAACGSDAIARTLSATSTGPVVGFSGEIKSSQSGNYLAVLASMLGQTKTISQALAGALQPWAAKPEAQKLLSYVLFGDPSTAFRFMRQTEPSRAPGW